MSHKISDTSDFPREASIDRLLRLIELVNDEPEEKTALMEQLGVNNDAAYDTIRLGTGLGFLLETDHGVTTTDLGAQFTKTEAVHSGKLFQIGLRNHKTYRTILETLDKKGLIHGGPLERETVIKTLRHDFGLELSSKTIKERVHTMFRTLEASNLGTFVSGNPSTITHFKFSSDYRESLNTLIHEKTDDRQQDEKPDQISGTSPENIQTSLTEDQFLSNGGEKDKNIQVNFNFEIDQSTSPKQIEELVLSIRRAMARELAEKHLESKSD